MLSISDAWWVVMAAVLVVPLGESMVRLVDSDATLCPLEIRWDYAHRCRHSALRPHVLGVARAGRQADSILSQR